METRNLISPLFVFDDINSERDLISSVVDTKIKESLQQRNCYLFENQYYDEWFAYQLDGSKSLAHRDMQAKLYQWQ